MTCKILRWLGTKEQGSTADVNWELHDNVHQHVKQGYSVRDFTLSMIVSSPRFASPRVRADSQDLLSDLAVDAGTGSDTAEKGLDPVLPTNDVIGDEPQAHEVPSASSASNGCDVAQSDLGKRHQPAAPSGVSPWDPLLQDGRDAFVVEAATDAPLQVPFARQNMFTMDAPNEKSAQLELVFGETSHVFNKYSEWVNSQHGDASQSAARTDEGISASPLLTDSDQDPCGSSSKQVNIVRIKEPEDSWEKVH